MNHDDLVSVMFPSGPVAPQVGDMLTRAMDEWRVIRVRVDDLGNILVTLEPADGIRT